MPDAKPQTVELVDPAGNKCHASHPADITNLVYGRGYRFVDKDMNPDKAAAFLAEKGPAAEQIAATLAVETAGQAPAEGQQEAQQESSNRRGRNS